MRLAGFTLLATVASTVSSHTIQARQEDALRAQVASLGPIPQAQAACAVLKVLFKDVVSCPNTTAYDRDNSDYWASASKLGPACVFAPTRPQQLGTGLLVLKAARSPFAVRGGGHMPIGDFNNIGSDGVLVSSSGFKQLSLSPDKKTVNVGPSNRWGVVYRFLEPQGLAVVGGRLGIVGVPGLVTGGGVSFFGNQYGWSANNVASFTVVLASGQVVTANAQNQYSDLFWALKGGGNSFAIVTNLELKTMSVPSVTIGDNVYGTGEAVKQKWLNAIAQLGQNGNQDPKHAVIPLASKRQPSSPISYLSTLFYNGNNVNPTVLQNFTTSGFNTSTSTFRSRTFASYVTEGETTQPAQQATTGRRFYFKSIPSNARALEIIHDTFFQVVKDQVEPKIPTISAILAAMPMPTAFFQAALDRGSDPMGVDPASGPFIWLEFSHSYPAGQANEDALDAYLPQLDKILDQNLAAEGFAPDKFLYLNDAEKFQDVFGGYKRENVQRLKQIRAKYDRSRLLTDQLRGGWKVDP